MMPADPLAPAGITWEIAMTRAAELLAMVDGDMPLFSPKQQGLWTTVPQHAQAWIAFARELTMHTRAGQSGPSRP
jgi:hypothetical protein